MNTQRPKQTNHTDMAEAFHTDLQGEVTLEAAEFLYVSRSFVAKLLENGVLPYRQSGSHRDIPYVELATYRDQERARARKAMQRLTRQSEDPELYESDKQGFPGSSSRGTSRL